MTISVVFEFPHDSVGNYLKVFDLGGPAVADQPDRLHHQCFETGEGFTVVDIWSSEESFAKFGELLGPALQQLGLSTVPVVHATRRTVSRSGDIADY